MWYFVTHRVGRLQERIRLDERRPRSEGLEPAACLPERDPGLGAAAQPDAASAGAATGRACVGAARCTPADAILPR